MGQSKHVSEFVHGFLFSPLQENCPVFGKRIKSLVQTSERDYGQSSSHFGFTKNKVESLGIEIDFRYSEDNFSLFKLTLHKAWDFAQDTRGIILASRWIQ